MLSKDVEIKDGRIIWKSRYGTTDTIYKSFQIYKVDKDLYIGRRENGEEFKASLEELKSIIDAYWQKKDEAVIKSKSKDGREEVYVEEDDYKDWCVFGKNTGNALMSYHSFSEAKAAADRMNSSNGFGPAKVYKNSKSKDAEAFTSEEAKQIGDKIGVDWGKHSLENFTIGLNVELEHGSKSPATNITNNSPEMTGKIALCHMNEVPGTGKGDDYYSLLKKYVDPGV